MGYDLNATNRCIKLFSDSQKAFMRSERRTALQSVLFDLPRRSSLGWYCFYRKVQPVLKQLAGRITPEEIGQRMKRLCSRPNYLTLSILMCSYFGARQQRMLDLGIEPGQPFPEEDVEQTCYVVDFWQRACRAYRNDGLRMPVENQDTQPIFNQTTVDLIAEDLVQTDREQRVRIRRMAATLEIYAFILHGEQRDGIFAHGPYRASDGSLIVIREFTDLQNHYLPWAATETGNRYPHLAVALKLRKVGARFDLFGGVVIEPYDCTENIVAQALLTCSEDGQIRVVPFDEIPEIERRAADAQNELYLKAVEWSPRFKIEYGVHLFANHLKSFFDLAGLDAGERIRSEFQSAAEELIERLVSGSEPPSIWKFMATTENDFFYPVTERS